MKDLIKNILAENKRSKNPHLDIGKCGLTELPDALFEHVWLETLVVANEYLDWGKGEWIYSKNKGKDNNLSSIPFQIQRLVNLKTLIIGGKFFDNWKISNLEPLSKLVNLTSLYLRYNQIVQTEPLSKLVKLISLDLSGNQIVQTEPLSKLLNLTSLSLRGNQIVQTEPLSKLVKLTSLDLRFNQISQTEPLSKLVNLTSLSLSYNQIVQTEPLSKLVKLTSLDLSNNQIRQTEPLSKLLNLTSLYLQSNQIVQTEPLSKLLKLTSLYLSSNRIVQTEPLSKLVKLTSLYLSDNQITEVTLDWLRQWRHLNELQLYSNPILQIPKNIYEQYNCYQALKDYLEALEEGKVRNQEAKVLLIGNGRVGKTCIVKRWLHKTYNPDEKSTHGIQIEELALGGLQLSVWDFGGQDIYHATHQLFMRTRAVYLLVWDWESEYESPKHQDHQQNEFDNYPLAYWLNYWKALSEGSPLLLLQNKTDKPEYEWEEMPHKDKKYLGQHYGLKPRDFIPLSAKTGEGFDTFKERLVKKLQGMREIEEMIPQSWAEVRTAIRKLQKKGERTLDYAAYQALCDKAKVSLISPTSHKTLMDFLHHTGVCFYQSGLFNDEIILDQAWAIDAVYTLFDREGMYYRLLKGMKGKFTKAELLQYWKEYEEGEQKLFISFMKSCEIIFGVREDGKKHEEPDYYIAPQLLPLERGGLVDEFWDRETQCRYFRYKYDFLHQGILSRFLVRVGQRAENKAMWRYGVWLKVSSNCFQKKEMER